MAFCMTLDALAQVHPLNHLQHLWLNPHIHIIPQTKKLHVVMTDGDVQQNLRRVQSWWKC